MHHKTQSRNILDKTDRSHAPMPNDGKILKRHKYNWNEIGACGVFMLLPKESLNIDAAYQREVISEGKVRKIAAKWCPASLGTITVNEREDGSYWIVDGGHRTHASFLRDDVLVLPCMVHRLGGIEVENEARIFLTSNTLQTSVSAITKHRAMIVAGDELAIKVQAIIDGAGLKLTCDANIDGHIKCVKAISDAVHIDEDLARRCLVFCAALISDKPVSKKVFSGLFYLCQNANDKEDILTKYGPRLKQKSQEELKTRIDGYLVEFGGTGNSRNNAIGLLRVINKRRKRKLRLREKQGS